MTGWNLPPGVTGGEEEINASDDAELRRCDGCVHYRTGAVPAFAGRVCYVFFCAENASALGEHEDGSPKSFYTDDDESQERAATCSLYVEA